MIRDHYEALRARLETDAALAGKGSDSIKLNDRGELIRETYWVLSGGETSYPIERMTATQASGDLESVFNWRLISPSANAVRIGIDKASQLLRGWVPVIAGRSCAAATVDVFEVEPDLSVRPPIFFADVEITLRSSAA